MNNTNVYDDLRQILARGTLRQQLEVELKDDLVLRSDLNVDSAMLVDIVLDIEERYSISVGDDEIDRLRTVGDLVKLISGASPNLQ